MNKSLNIKIFLSVLFLLSFTFPAFSQDKLPGKENIQDENIDIVPDKKLNLELGISGFMLQFKTLFLLNDKFNPYIRFAFGEVVSKQTQFLGPPGLDIEAGLKYNFINATRNKKAFLNNFYKDIHNDFFMKVFAGATKNIFTGLPVYPFSGLGLGFSTTNKSIEFSMGIDLGSTFEYSPNYGLGGVIFLRPEMNMGYVF